MPDVVSVPEAAGREALARLLGYGQPAVAPGPVALSAGGRVLFYVASGGAEDLPELLEWLDWGGVRLDLRAVPVDELTDPPVRWLHPATVPMQRPGGWRVPVTMPPGQADIDWADDAGDAVDAVDAESNGDVSGDIGDIDGVDVNGVDAGTHVGTVPSPAHAGRDNGSRREAYPTPGLPEPPELIALLATIAAACHRLAVAAAR
jgi:hypothetical protein